MLYDTIYAHQDKSDDVQVGINSSALWIGERNAKLSLGLFATLSCVGFGASGYALDAHWPYYAGVVSSAAHMAWQVYTAKLDEALNRLHEEGRYRTFIDIERKNGQFPHATWRKPDGSEQPITVWCGNDYLGMGQHPAVSKQTSRRGVGTREAEP